MAFDVSPVCGPKRPLSAGAQDEAFSRYQLDLTADEMAAIDRWSSMAGFRTRKEFLLNAITLFQWAAKQVMPGRTICAIDERSGEVHHLEMPALAAISECAARRSTRKRGAGVPLDLDGPSMRFCHGSEENKNTMPSPPVEWIPEAEDDLADTITIAMNVRRKA